MKQLYYRYLGNEQSNKWMTCPTRWIADIICLSNWILLSSHARSQFFCRPVFCFKCFPWANLEMSQWTRLVAEEAFVFATELCISLLKFIMQTQDRHAIFSHIDHMPNCLQFQENNRIYYVDYYVMCECYCELLCSPLNCYLLWVIITQEEALRIAAVVIVQNDQIWHWPYK